MHYWDQMQSKWGFADGDAVPRDAHAAREVYVAGVNRLAERFGSRWRVGAYDRPGLHNHCLVVTLPAGADLAGAIRTGACGGGDEALDKAVEVAHAMMLDDYIVVRAEVDTAALHSALDGLDDQSVEALLHDQSVESLLDDRGW